MSLFFNSKMRIFIRRIILTLFLFFSCLQFNKSYQEAFDVPMRMHIYLGTVFLLLAVWVIRRIPLNRFETWSTLIAGVVVKYIYFTKMNISPLTYGTDYYRLVNYRWIAMIVFAALIIDLIRQKTILKLFKRANLFFYVMLAAITLAVVMRHEAFIPLICPIIALYFTYTESIGWDEFTDSFAIGFYGAFVFVMAKSLYEAPDVFQSGRYYGTFSNVYSAGIIAGGAILCVVYAYYRMAEFKFKTAVRVIVSLLLVAFPLYSVAIIKSRTVEVSLLFVALIFAIFMGGGNKKSISIKLIVLAVIASIGLVGIVLASQYYYNKRAAGELNNCSYFVAHLIALADPEKKKGVFGESSILNSLNAFTSGRLNLLYYSLKQVRLVGHPFEVVHEVKGAASAHNFFVQWLVEYGAVGGFVFIAWYVACFVKAVIAFVNKKKCMPLLWISYTFVIFMALTGTWLSVEAFFLLVLQYPLLMKHMNDSGSHATE